MKPLTKILLIIFILCVVSAGSWGASSSETRHKQIARQIFIRTAAVIAAAQQLAAEGHQYAGLGLALAHHRFSRRLYINGMYRESIFHSLRARALAAHVIMLNKSDLLQDALYDQHEQKLLLESPPAEQLDQKLKNENEKVKNDKDAANEPIAPDPGE